MTFSTSLVYASVAAIASFRQTFKVASFYLVEGRRGKSNYWPYCWTASGHRSCCQWNWCSQYCLQNTATIHERFYITTMAITNHLQKSTLCQFRMFLPTFHSNWFHLNWTAVVWHDSLWPNRSVPQTSHSFQNFINFSLGSVRAILFWCADSNPS